MLDSFYHAAHSVLFGDAPGVIAKPESLNALEAWAKYWFGIVHREFMEAYLATPHVALLLPASDDHIGSMVRLFLLDLAMHKLTYELSQNPQRIRIPTHAILELLDEAGSGGSRG